MSDLPTIWSFCFLSFSELSFCSWPSAFSLSKLISASAMPVGDKGSTLGFTIRVPNASSQRCNKRKWETMLLYSKMLGPCFHLQIKVFKSLCMVHLFEIPLDITGNDITDSYFWIRRPWQTPIRGSGRMGFWRQKSMLWSSAYCAEPRSTVMLNIEQQVYRGTTRYHLKHQWLRNTALTHWFCMVLSVMFLGYCNLQKLQFSKRGSI